MGKAELIERARTAEGTELCELASVHVMGWEEDRDTDGTLYGWFGEGAPCVSKVADWRPDLSLDIAATLEAEIEKMGLWQEYYLYLKFLVGRRAEIPAAGKRCGFRIEYTEIDHRDWHWLCLIRATALQRTRAAVIVAVEAKEETE